MPKFIVERPCPGAGKMTEEEIRDLAEQTCGVVRVMGPRIQWVESFITDDKLFCIFIAPNEDAVFEHSTLGRFPVEAIFEVRRIIDPTSATLMH
jgi:hypothetical protein